MNLTPLEDYERLALRNLELEGQVSNMQHSYEQHVYRAELNYLYGREMTELYTKLRNEPRWWPIQLKWRWGRWDKGGKESRFLRWGIDEWYGRATVLRLWRLTIVMGRRPDLVAWKRRELDGTREQRIKALQDRLGIVYEPDTEEDS